ncbi:MAG: hypothetical protein GY746_18550, partial [Gammaproteobacteria bacterium]|nr:hypothetical protein [Gammaproteobacteria bacterium]
APGAKLHVVGRTRIDGDRLEFVNTGHSVFIGDGAGANDNFTDNFNVAIGASALFNNTTGYQNVANGSKALYSNTTGIYNVANGSAALMSNTTGDKNVATGYRALYSNTYGESNVANGFQALYSNETGYRNVANGYYALYSNTTGIYNVANGYKALWSNTTGTYNTAIGCYADVSYDSLTNATAIGANAIVSQDSSLVLGNAARVGIGTSAPTNDLDVNGSIRMRTGAASGYVPVSDASGVMTWTDPSTFPGDDLGNHTATQALNLSSNNITNGGTITATSFAGDGSGLTNIAHDNLGNHTATQNLKLNSKWLSNDGDNEGVFVSASGNVGIGDSSPTHTLDVAGTIGINDQQILYVPGGLFINTLYLGNGGGSLSNSSYWEGTCNTAVGLPALTVNTTGYENTAIGYGALNNNTTGDFNTASGSRALQINSTGDNNTAIGRGALDANSTGSNNTAIGYDADVSSSALTNATAIGNGATVNASNKVRIGNSSVTVIQGQVDFTFSSDKNKKENFLSVDGEHVLEEIRQFNLQSWNYKGHDPATQRHYGPMAQDFFRAFGSDEIGTVGNDTTLTGSDVAGINMIAVKALEKRTAELLQTNETLMNLVSRLSERVDINEIAPYMVSSYDKDGTDYLNVDASPMTFMLVNAVKEQQEIIEAQREENEKQQSEIEALKAKADEVDVLKAEIENIKSVLGMDSEMAKNK